MPSARKLPRVDELQDYGHAVAGHAGTLCDVDGQVFVKPCTQAEIDFYQLAKSNYPDLADLMPVYYGALVKGILRKIDLDQVMAGVASNDGIQTVKEETITSIKEQIANATREAETTDTITWVPSQGNRINTNTLVVLENLTHGFEKPNVLDIKVGTRLYADDAPKQKQERFEKISRETTHHNLGFRIAGMRVYRGSEDASELDGEGYKNYDKDYGRFIVNDDNVVNELKRFMFNEAAGIDEALAKAVCAAFSRELSTIHDVMYQHHTRIYSASLLFVYEGDGDALRRAIHLNNEYVDRSAGPPATKRIDSGIALDDEDEAQELASDLPPVFKTKIIDFAHAKIVPGLGPDENFLKGVSCLEEFFTRMAE